MHPSAASPFNAYAPPTKSEQIALAHERGPADETDLEQLAQHCEYQNKIGAFHFGHCRAEQLRMLAKSLGEKIEIPSNAAGSETIDSLVAHAKNGGVFVTADQCRALARLIIEYEESLAYAARKLERRADEVQQLQRAVGDLANQVEESENDREPIVFLFAFDEDAPPDAMGIELALELVSLLDALPAISQN